MGRILVADDHDALRRGLVRGLTEAGHEVEEASNGNAAIEDQMLQGVLQFGTELIGSADNSIVALLGASPGASTSAFIAVQVLEKGFYTVA